MRKLNFFEHLVLSALWLILLRVILRNAAAEPTPLEQKIIDRLEQEIAN